MHKLFVVLIALLTSNFVQANSDLDIELAQYIKQFKMRALDKIQDNNPKLTQLGWDLYHDQRLSRNNNIGCFTCHSGRLGTSDGLPLSIGEGGVGMGPSRVQGQARITKRHSTHLINKGHPEFKHMFWDGRVQVNKDGTLNTPEPALNGVNPKRADIAKLLTTPLAVQAIFPIANDGEMFGINNEGFSNLEKWDIIAKRIWADTKYQQEFKQLYSIEEKDFNIGYIAQALAHFQKHRFQVTDTKWDKYLRGDENALTLEHKWGAKVFLTKGRCAVCHNGPHLGGQAFQNSATPQLIHSETKNDDLGRFEVTGKESHKYMFKIPPLRYLVHTSPYFHNGVFMTIDQVVEHYNDPYKSLRNFNTQFAMGQYAQNYVTKFAPMTKEQIEARLKRLPMHYRHHGSLGLTYLEKRYLIKFLREALDK